MNIAIAAPPAGQPSRVFFGPAGPRSAIRVDADVAEQDAAFLQMLAAYRGHGGLRREAEVLRRRQALDAAVTPDDEAIRFDWGGSTWMPWFQFDARSGRLHEPCRRVIDELAPFYDGWLLALWFVQPNVWIHGGRPLDVLAVDPRRVHEAARVDRFVAGG